MNADGSNIVKIIDTPAPDGELAELGARTQPVKEARA